MTTQQSPLVPASFLACASCLLPPHPSHRVKPAGAGLTQFASPSRPEPPLRQPLTPAEQRVLGLVLAGLADKEIATVLDRAVPTIKHQVSSVLQKHGVSSRARLLAVLHGGVADAEPGLLQRLGS